MSDNLITLYDLTAPAGDGCWSPNVLKTRLLLNYKDLPYKTEWIDLVDIAPTLESYGIKPNPPQTMGASVGTRYTLPAIQLPHKSFVMDSVSIAIELESRYPEPSLRLDAASYEEAQGLVFKCALPLFPEYMPRIRDNLITDHSKAFWVRTREDLFGMTVDEFQKTKGGEQAWQAAQPGLQALAEFLTKYKRDAGPFTLGSQVSYADLVLVAFLESTKRTSLAIFERIISSHSSIKELYKPPANGSSVALTEAVIVAFDC